jgi:beta-phosphoglucomutase-like phosphatase (HAD superfamily)
MVRNIDLVEALIFYGEDALIEGREAEDDLQSFSLIGGVKDLLEECRRDETAVIAILDKSPRVEQITEYLKKQHPIVQIKLETQPPPSPQDLWVAIHHTTILPKGFGGSSGFGTKAADPERSPLSRHCVVLASTENQCRAARYAGMRVICLNDNLLADAVLSLDWSSIGMDDIATPGSFWLNPPHPKDDAGNRVDVEAVIETYQQQQQRMKQRGKGVADDTMGNATPVILSTADLATDELSDIELRKILADMDPI